MDNLEAAAMRTFLFSLGAAFVVYAITNVVMAAAHLIAHGLMYFDYYYARLQIWSLQC